MPFNQLAPFFQIQPMWEGKVWRMMSEKHVLVASYSWETTTNHWLPCKDEPWRENFSQSDWFCVWKSAWHGCLRGQVQFWIHLASMFVSRKSINPQPLNMLQTFLHYLSFVFPHTSSRLAHWYHLLFHNNTELFGLQNVVIILPTCIYVISDFASRRLHDDDDDDDEVLLENRNAPFRVINNCITFWFLMYKAFDLVAALDMVLKTSGFCNKVIVRVYLGPVFLFWFRFGTCLPSISSAESSEGPRYKPQICKYWLRYII